MAYIVIIINKDERFGDVVVGRSFQIVLVLYLSKLKTVFFFNMSKFICQYIKFIYHLACLYITN